MPARQVIACAALAGMAMAAPQKLDFAALANAPAVASGPTELDVPVQTASLFTSFSVSGVAVAAATPAANLNERGLFNFFAPAPAAKPAVQNKAAASAAVPATVIASTVVNPTPNVAVGKVGANTIVDANGSLILNGGNSHSITGDLTVLGKVIVSIGNLLNAGVDAVAGLTASLSASPDDIKGSLVVGAGGLVQVNGLNNTLVADAFAAVTVNATFEISNGTIDGSLQICGAAGVGVDALGSTFQLIADLDFYLNGLISLEQYGGNAGNDHCWKNSAPQAGKSSVNVYNNGAFRLINTILHEVQNVLGNGCWELDIGAVLYLEAGVGIYGVAPGAQVFAGQNINFNHKTAVLHIAPAVYAHNSFFGARIYGFGAGNAIEFEEEISSYLYNALDGLLTVWFKSGASINLNIGLGYNAFQFSKGLNPSTYNSVGFNAIFYAGVGVSLGLPSCCGIPAAIPPCTLPSGLPIPTTVTASTKSASASASASVSKSSGSAPGTATTKSSPSSFGTSSVRPTGTGATKTSSVPLTTATTCPNTYSKYTPTYSLTTTPNYPALATSYTTNPALTGTTTAGQACPTQPEAGTYCGFINPEDPCAPQPGYNGNVPTPDTASAFQAYPPFHSAANAAPSTVPSTNCTEYVQVFKDLNASVSANSYLGLYTLQEYDVRECAALCDSTKLCTAFNIFAERDPSLNPTRNDSTAPTVWGYYCPNPPSLSNFQCTLWGSSISAQDATNTGGYRESFHIVVAGSDGYDKTNVTIPDSPTVPASTSTATSTGSSGATSSSSAPTTKVTGTGSILPTISSTPVKPSTVASTWTGGFPIATWPSSGSQPGSCTFPPPVNGLGLAIDAELYFLASAVFPGPYNPQACSDFAIAQNKVNAQAGASQSVAMFNAYYINKNGSPFATYCSLYNTPLNATYATYAGGQFQGDLYEVKQSFIWDLTVELDICLGISISL